MTQDLHHLAAAYALDALEPDERAAFEAHYPSCDICATEVVEFRETAAVLAADQATAPPHQLRAAVLAEISRTRQLSPPAGGAVVDLSQRRRRAAQAALGAAAVVAILLGAIGVIRSTGGGDEFAEVVAADDALGVTLEGDQGTIEAVWSPDRDQVALLASGLEPAGQGLTYALWFFVDDAPVPAGLFAPEADGRVRAVLDIDDITGDGWGVTIEPDGGSPQPTGDVLFVGTL